MHVHERCGEQRFVAALDADGDGLGLVLDRIDRARQFVDGLGQLFGQAVDDGTGCAGFAKLDCELIEWCQLERVVAQGRQTCRRASFERAVVATEQQVLAEREPMRL